MLSLRFSVLAGSIAVVLAIGAATAGAAATHPPEATGPQVGPRLGQIGVALRPV